MVRRLHALFLRYAAVHSGRYGGAPIGPFWRRVGRVEQVTRRGRQIEITGWAGARRVVLRWPGGEIATIPDLSRPDVKAHRGGPPNQGFRMVAPASWRSMRLEVTDFEGGVHSVRLAHPSDGIGGRNRLRLRWSFARDICRALPAFVSYIIDPGVRSRSAIKRALGLELGGQTFDLDPAWLYEGGGAERALPPEGVTVVLPVFNAFRLLRNCLSRLEENTETRWHLILVEDASTDPPVRPWIDEWAGQRRDRVTVLHHQENLGFVAAANSGFDVALARTGRGPIILLNSDAMLPRNWASRLCAPFSDPSVASVTPMSNSAEILSVPTIGPGIALSPGEGDKVDAAAERLGLAPLPAIPTGVGFCMAISRNWLARVPRFDAAFGRGYGEEVDWCRKVLALGGRHLCQPGLFVEHVGGQSFGSEQKKARVAAAGSLISRRYPRYDAEVQHFIASDPLATPRLALTLALISARSQRVPVYLAHSLGGGAEAALKSELETHGAAVVLRVGGARRWQVEAHIAGRVVAGSSDDLELVKRLLADARALDLIYSCGVGDPDPISLPAALLSLRRDGRPDRLAMRLHDYFPVSPSYTLMGRDGFVGVPEPENQDPCHSSRRPDGTRVTLAQWRAAWGELVQECAEITSFSEISARLFSQAFGRANVSVHPHRRPIPVHPMRAHLGRAVGILGNLNVQKGALLIRDLAQAHPRQTFVVIGLVDSSIPFPRNVVIHGSYEREDITELGSHYGICAWLMPSVWPETFSFATREALATGLPVAGFELGAQGEALRAASNGITVPLEPKSGAADRLFSVVDPAQSLQLAAE